MPQAGLRVGVVFGGRSVEHDVSIITGLQACEVLAARHTPVPIYIDRGGRWFAGDGLRDIEAYRGDTVPGDPAILDAGAGVLRSVPSPPAEPRRRGMFGGGGRETPPSAPSEIALDVVLPACHGTQGEDGALQGLLELAELPYAGPTVEAAVLGMNKAITKAMLRAAGIPVLEDLTLRRADYEREGAEAIVARVRSRFGLPVYVKPASLGSSVGVSRCGDDAQLADALALAFELDRVAIVEPAVEGGRELQCAVLGRVGRPDELRVSACDQPVATDGFLSFEDKYMREGGKQGDGAGGKAPEAAKGSGELAGRGMAAAGHLIPAPISDEQTERVQELARRTFAAIGGTGVARVDLLSDDQERLFVNEPNTIPGSFSFYMFEPAGLAFADLLDALIDIAFAEHADKRATTRTFASNLLAARGQGAKT